MFMPTPYPNIILKEILKNLPLILKAVIAFAEALKLTDKEDAEKLGDKAIQAEDENITPENYDNYEEYYEAVHNFELDEEKSKNIDENEKANKGIELVVKLIDSAYPQMQIPKLMEIISKSDSLQDFVTPEHFAALAKTALEDPEFMEKVTLFIDGKDMKSEDYLAVVGKLVEIEASIHPEKNQDECKKYVESLG